MYGPPRSAGPAVKGSITKRSTSVLPGSSAATVGPPAGLSGTTSPTARCCSAGMIRLADVVLGPSTIFSRRPIESMEELRHSAVWRMDNDEIGNALSVRMGVRAITVPVSQAARWTKPLVTSLSVRTSSAVSTSGTTMAPTSWYSSIWDFVSMGSSALCREATPRQDKGRGWLSLAAQTYR